ncbi:MAG: nucleotidyltransferase [Eubacteriales bacterium]
MKICGIIAEYDPFHLGHAYHLDAARKSSGADAVAVAMSASFVQRGYPAMFDKWTRAKCALASGADIVFELSALGSLQSAEGFASAGVKLLNEIGATSLSFGCETPDITFLSSVADVLINEPENYRAYLKESLSAGHSFVKSRGEALKKYLSLDSDKVSAINKPNNILAIEYLKAIKRYAPTLSPLPIKRKGSGYHENSLSDKLASASAIRKGILANSDILSYVPKACYELLKEQIDLGNIRVLNDFSESIFNSLIKLNKEGIALLPDVSEGLENKIFSSLKSHPNDLDEFINAIKSSRYTKTRINRILINALIGITKEAILKFNQSPPQYIKVLGIKKASKHLLSYISKKASCPIIYSASNIKNEFLDLDILATNLYLLKSKTFNRDYTERLIEV